MSCWTTNRNSGEPSLLVEKLSNQLLARLYWPELMRPSASSSAFRQSSAEQGLGEFASALTSLERKTFAFR